MSRSPLSQRRFWFKIFFNAIALILLVIVCYQLNPNELLQRLLVWIKDLGWLGVVIFICIYNIATIIFIPGSLLTIGGGVIYGVWLGSIYVFIASTLGATLAFLIGRYFARGWISQKIHNHMTFRAIDAAIAKEGFKIVFLARLSPIFPFNMLNYAFGVTRVALRDYILGSIGMIPATVMYVYLGSLIMDISQVNSQPSLSPQAEIIQWCIRFVGLMATILVSVYISRIAKKTLRQITHQ